MIDGFGRSLLASSAIVAMVAATPAQAQTKSFDVAAQPAQTGVAVFGKQADIQIVAARKHTAGKRTNSVRGEMSVEEGLRQLLAGTGLTFKATGGQTYMIVPLAGAAAASGGTQQAQGQAVLVGSVRDHKTGAALKGARVEVVETGASTSTGDLGDFRFARLPTGDVTLRVSYLGFPEQTETVAVVGGLTNRADVYLGSGVTTEIVVIGQVSARAQALNQERTAENSTTVISGDLLGNFNGTTISDSLRRAPGVAFQQNDATGDGTNVIVRGLSPDYNQVKLNGIALPEGSGVGRSANLSNILSDSISEIKISKTLLASQDSAGTGGLIEIETKSPLDRPRRYFNLSAEGTKRGKGFGRDYLLSGTASLRFGAEGNFGVSASYQHRDQDVTTYSYDTQGIPGAYLPLAPNGAPAEPADIDPRTSFPFDEGADYYITNGLAGRNSVKSKTSTLTLSAEWDVSDATNLRLDYVRSRRKSDTLSVGYTISPCFGGYFNVQPVPAEGGDPRYVYSDICGFVLANTNVNYSPKVAENTDSLSFRGTSSAGPLTLDYRAGYSRGSLRSPFYASFGFGDFIPADSITLAPEAIDPATGTVPTYFGPRRGRGIPVPLLSAAGFEGLRSGPPSNFNGLSGGRNENGHSDNFNGRISAKYEFGGGLLKYVEAGADYTRSTYRSTARQNFSYDAVRDPNTFLGAPIPDLGIEFEDMPFGAVTGRDTVYKFATRRSLLGFLNNLDALVDGGYATYSETPLEALLGDQKTSENALALYGQARADIGKLEVIGGLRFDRNRVRASFLDGIRIYDVLGNLDTAYFDQTRRIIDGRDTLTTWLPRILLNYRPTRNIVVRAGYFSTIARPQVRQLSSERSITYSASPTGGPTFSQPTLFISEGNPGLKPARTHNFDVGIEWYDGKVGAIKVNAFLKKIENLLESNAVAGFENLGDFELPDHPVFQNLPANLYVEYSYPVNNPDTATVWGVEASIERRFDFLPGFLSGLGIYANYAYSHSEKVQNFTWSTAPVYDAGGVLVDRESIVYQRTLPFDQSPKHSGTIGLTYTRPGFDATLYYTAQSRRQNTPSRYGLDFYEEAVNSLDFRGVYSFKLGGSDMRFSLEALNLLKSRGDANTERSIGGVGGVPKYYTGGYYLGGRSVSLGLSATF